MSTATAKETAVVTNVELLELAAWERKFADAKKKASAAENELAFRRLSLAEKVLGVKSADELKKLSPREVERRHDSRLAAGDWKPERGAPEFAFTKTSEGRYPSWSQIYAEKFGETAAAEIRSKTPTTYSYSVEVAL